MKDRKQSQQEGSAIYQQDQLKAYFAGIECLVLHAHCLCPQFRYHQPHDISTCDVRPSMACMQAAQGSREQEGFCQAAHLGAPGAGWVQRGLCSHSHHAPRLCQDHHSVWQQPAGATGAQGCCAAAWPCRSLQRNGEFDITSHAHHGGVASVKYLSFSGQVA